MPMFDVAVQSLIFLLHDLHEVLGDVWLLETNF
jgi:hypothetical protein